jgi:ubiquinone/menaquinone biosynthesis C-methylase UbiE
MKGKCQKVVGIDVDRNAASNPYLDEFFLIEDYIWPYLPDESIDLIICDYVLEHIEFPEKLFSEFNRVLKVGGLICCRTPNLFSYFGLASNFVPGKFHQKIVPKLQAVRKEEDIFPKFYRCNSIYRLKRILKQFNFKGVVYGFESEPAYFTFSQIIYLVMKFLHSITPNYFKTQIFVFARKEVS